MVSILANGGIQKVRSPRGGRGGQPKANKNKEGGGSRGGQGGGGTFKKKII